MFKLSRALAPALLCVVVAGLAPAARAGIFDDDEARKAILDLRQRLEQTGQKIEQGNERQRALQAEQISRLSDQITQSNAQSAEQIATLKRSLLDLNSQLELLRADNAKLRGQDEQRTRDYEQLTRSVAELQRKQKDITEGVEDRIRKIEPQKVTVDDKEFLADPDEKRIYEEAMASLRKGEFDKAAPALSGFLRRYPVSGYAQSAQFWLGNALYGKREYKDAIASFRALVSTSPDYPRAAEALLAVANCEIELKDTKSARKTIAELLKAYPKSEAAQAGRDRLVTLK